MNYLTMKNGRRIYFAIRQDIAKNCSWSWLSNEEPQRNMMVLPRNWCVVPIPSAHPEKKNYYANLRRGTGNTGPR